MFKELETELKTAEPKDFLTLLKEKEISDYKGYLLFNLTNIESNFYQNLEFLKDDDIWLQEELKDYAIVAQTIDNDYVLATDTSVLVIPYSLNKKDSEFFELSSIDFFIQLEEKNLNSNILAS
ncbi:hypothetical protein [Vagococcus hydrophili]|uniref:Uncharacterized protein n=1 Tax=Vagococcus hydrophili TaxID=2714947 RepID=A0A6G8AR11_9ENTE|nr:hypothetical protein [Vagococcus hydrophili]QIL47511.1 hypothetical protein G7082_02660 [Vagococcus hydrophili]